MKRAAVLAIMIALFLFVSLAHAEDTKKASIHYDVLLKQTGPDDNKGQIIITIKPRTGRKINKEFPVKFTATPGPNVTVKKSPLTKADASKLEESELVMPVGFELSQTAGAGAFIKVLMSFGTCEIKGGEVTSCMPHKEENTITITTKK